MPRSLGLSYFVLGLVLVTPACFGGTDGGSAGAEGQGMAGVPAGGGVGGTTATAGSGAGTGAGTGGTATGGVGAAGTSGTAGVPGTGGAAGVDGTAGAAGHDMAGEGGTGGDDPIAACDLQCDVGTHCELVQVQCIQAPCPPVEECVDDPFCGGFAGFACPGMGECHDDPRDDCDPMHGGADCGGICGCADHGTCADGQRWDSSPVVCACVATDGDAGGETCGKSTCEKGMVCCNPSCGICAPPDGACIQLACL